MDARKQKIYNELESIAKAKEGFLTSDYVSGSTKIKVKCKNDHSFALLPSKLRNGDWCPICGVKTSDLDPICAVLSSMDIDFKKNHKVENYTFDLVIEIDSKVVLIEFDSDEKFKKSEALKTIREKVKLARKLQMRVIRIEKSIIENDLESFLTESISSNVDLIVSDPSKYSWLDLENKQSSPDQELFTKQQNFDEKTNVIRSGIILGYCRVSTQEQASKGISLDSQADKIRQYAEFKNMYIKEMYVDAGISGKNIEDRPALVRLLDDIKPKEHLVVLSLSRLIRNAKQATEIDELLKKKGAYLIALDLDVNTRTAVGRLIFQVFNSLNEFERTQTAERISINLNYKSQHGKLQTKAPYGWKFEGPGQEWSRVETEQKVIQEMREWKRKEPQITVAEITRRLNAECAYGLVLRKAKIWYHNQVKNILIQNHIFDESVDRCNRNLSNASNIVIKPPDIQDLVLPGQFAVVSPQNFQPSPTENS